MDWRNSKSEKKPNLNENKYDKSDRSDRSDKGTVFKNVKNTNRFDDQGNNKQGNKFSYQNKRNGNGNNSSLPRFKSADEIDNYLSSGKYITSQKKSKLLEIKEKLLKNENRNELNFNEMSFPSLSGLNPTDTNSESPKSSTCWGNKLPESFYDTSVPFNTKFNPKSKPSQIVNSEISNDDEYDSYDEYLDDGYDQNYDDEEGF